METDEPFEFVVKEGKRKYNQRHYEALGEVCGISSPALTMSTGRGVWDQCSCPHYEALWCISNPVLTTGRGT
jgi:hypothetical protein